MRQFKHHEHDYDRLAFHDVCQVACAITCWEFVRLLPRGNFYTDIGALRLQVYAVGQPS